MAPAREQTGAGNGAPSAGKPALRLDARTRRDAITSNVRAAATRAIEARLIALPSVDTAHVIHCYIAMGSEVGTDELIRGLLLRGHRVVCPRVNGDTALEHLEVFDLDSLVDGPIGLREPDTRDATHIALVEVDVMLVPALSFDRDGYRLGYGGGYYDRTIEELRSVGHATTVGLAFESQLVDELPREEHDQPVDLIATELQTVVTGEQ